MSYKTLKAKTSQFLSCKNIAVIGVSSTNEHEAANGNYRALKQRGYHVIPVNPKVLEFEGEKCYDHVVNIKEPVDAALVFTHPNVTPEVVKECYDAGIKNIWVHRSFGQGSASVEATKFIKGKSGVNYIDGACPMMFIENADWFHKSIKTLFKWTGKLPD